MAFCGGSLAGLRRTAPQRGGCAETGCCRHGNGGKYIQDSSRKSALPSIGDDTPPRVARGFGGRRRVRAGRRRLSRALAASGRMTLPSDASLHAVMTAHMGMFEVNGQEGLKGSSSAAGSDPNKSSQTGPWPDAFRWALVKNGQAEKGVARLCAGLDAGLTTGHKATEPYWLALFAEACLETGRVEEGLSAVSEALAQSRRKPPFAAREISADS